MEPILLCSCMCSAHILVVFQCRAVAHMSGIGVSPSLKHLEAVELALVHSPCSDGYACAVLLHKKYPKMEIRPFTHGVTKLTADDVRNKRVLFADCCPPDIYKAVKPEPEAAAAGNKTESKAVQHSARRGRVSPPRQLERRVLKELCEAATSIFDIDHHPSTWDQLIANEWTEESKRPSNLLVVLDRSGVVAASRMVWELLHGSNVPMPGWLSVIARFDVGQFDVMTDEERALHCALTAATDQKGWPALALTVEDWDMTKEQQLIKQGMPMWEDRKAQIHLVLNDTSKIEHIDFACPGRIDPVKTIRAIYVELQEPQWILVSDLPAFVAKKWPLVELIIARRWLATNDPKNPERTYFSLRRSKTSTLDLNELGQWYGGGGHEAAAGVQYPNKQKYL